MEPIAIATLAFIGTKVGETLVEKFTEAVLPKANALRQKIWDKLRGNANAEIALQAAENGSKADLKRVAKYLDMAMDEDAEFATEVEKLAREIEKETGEDAESMVINIYGDKNNIFNSKNYVGTTNNIGDQTVHNYGSNNYI